MPVNSPVTPAAFAAALVGVGVGVGLASVAVVLLDVVVAFDDEFEFEFAAVELALLVEVVDFDAAEDLVVVAFEAVALFDVALADGEEDETDEADPVFACAPVVPTALPEGRASSVEPNCGGVIANTAPRPPSVPPAMSSVRFISVPSLPLTTPRTFPTRKLSRPYLKSL